MRLRITNQGFTLIELVLILVIVAILGVTVSSRFLSGNTFNAAVVRDQIISLTRNAQQAALGRATVSLTIQPDGSGNLDLELDDTNGNVIATQISLDGVTSFSGDVNNTASCTTGGTDITNGAPFIINFDSLGDLDASGFGAGTAVTSALRICVNDEPDQSICVSSAGFAYGGDCDS